MFCDNNEDIRKQASRSGNIESHYSGGFLNSKKNGEWIEVKGDKVIRRDFYKEDSLSLSIIYSKEVDSALYFQCFDGNGGSTQVVFNYHRYNKEVFYLEDSSISNIRKGQNLFSYYCRSCHMQQARDPYIKKMLESEDQISTLINSSSHPVKFEYMGEIEMKLITDFLSYNRLK